ncbi:MAG: zinc-binding dehydrogenase [Pseudomonadota bacterium]|nr:zinc-binding dehydrogenase [Pseudomonadota bacterium]
MSSNLPSRMRALVVKNHHGGALALELVEVPIPVPAAGEVLIRVAYAPLNPNDLLALRDAYDVKKPVGSVAGFEGSGRVVGGSGLMPRFLHGRRVAFASSPGGGSWAEFTTASAMQCLPLRAGVDDVQGATLLTNPITATVLLQQARSEGHRALVQAAAAGALGTMMARLAPVLGMTMIHVVRSEEQVAMLRGHGVEHVVDSSKPDWETELTALCRRFQATLALDPVGGAMSGTLLRALDIGGVVRVYGWLSGAPGVFDPNELVFRRKRIEGFTMYDWVKRTSRLRQFVTAMRAQGLLHGPLATHVRTRAPLGDYASAFTDNERSMSGGKILFSPASTTSS